MDHLDLYGSIAFTKGQILRDEGDKSPLGHIPPLYGRAGARWHTGRYHLEAFVLFNGKKRIQDYQLEGEDNEQYAPPDGMPAWLTLNLRSGLRFSSHFSLQAGVDNLLDIQYRTFSSGINGPGRNLFLTVRTAF
jgi:hemoglobin/transferrin/lactoferrin receptor protein